MIASINTSSNTSQQTCNHVMIGVFRIFAKPAWLGRSLQSTVVKGQWVGAFRMKIDDII